MKTARVLMMAVALLAAPAFAAKDSTQQTTKSVEKTVKGVEKSVKQTRKASGSKTLKKDIQKVTDLLKGDSKSKKSKKRTRR